MEELIIKRDLGYYSVEIIRDKEGTPLIVVKLKIENRRRGRKLSWCPTSKELEFLYRTMKWMEKSTSKTQAQEALLLRPIEETT